MKAYVLPLRRLDQSHLFLAGGKGANLGELSRIQDILVPEGFCITTDAYKAMFENDDELNRMVDKLNRLKGVERQAINSLCTSIRIVIESKIIQADITGQIEDHLRNLGDLNAYAVRSSATAEDLPTASFAGQQDTYLNIVGKESIIKHISKCWASLFTERAVIYRMQHGFDHHTVQLAVIIQQIVLPQAAGIMFTADPVTGNRKVVSIDASFGLGEALVSGLVNADNYRVQDSDIIEKRIGTKKLAIQAIRNGGTSEIEIKGGEQTRQALTDAQILQLHKIGRSIELHFGQPQDIEWCLVNDTFYIVQSRPITTLFPIPAAPANLLRPGEATDNENRVYISVGHQQMMTDPMKPLGLSFFLHTTNAPMHTAGGRLFVNVTPMLAAPASRHTLIVTLGKSDPLMQDALTTIVDGPNFIQTMPVTENDAAWDKRFGAPSTGILQAKFEEDPTIASRVVQQSETSIAALREKIATKSGTDLLDFVLEDIQDLKKILFDPESMRMILGGMDAYHWVNEKMYEWLGEKNAGDTVSQSVPNNVTSEMGLALMDLADIIRPYPAIIEFLQTAKLNNFLDELAKFDGGKVVQTAFEVFLNKYGMRCAGEIDITKPRWREEPSTLTPIVISNIRNLEPNAGPRRFEEGRQNALQKEAELLVRLEKLPDGDQKAKETKQMIALIRAFAGYREYPKYAKVSRYFIYKQALLKEAARLLRPVAPLNEGVIRERDDIYYLSVEELREVMRTNKLDYSIIAKRKEEYRLYEKLTPPRVITSDGEIITGKYKKENLPDGAIAGLAVSSGVIEGRARIILDMEDADIVEGDILVTAFTDPSWTPLFVSIKGLVTEVGGLMTHGSVIAREYGLPAVVGVENATRLIMDGQQIRVNGTDGYVEIL